MVRCLSNGVRETDQRNYSKENHRLLVEEVRGVGGGGGGC